MSTMHIDKTANPAFRVAIRFIFSPARPDSTGFSGQSKLVEPAARRCEEFPGHQKNLAGPSGRRRILLFHRTEPARSTPRTRGLISAGNPPSGAFTAECDKMGPTTSWREIYFKV
jgi:hypothetical protein